MATSPVSQQDYEALRNNLIEEHEDIALAEGAAQPPKLVGDHLTLGFGYDLATRKGQPGTILADLAAAGIRLTVKQIAAIRFYGTRPGADVGEARAEVQGHLDDLAAFGTLVAPDDRDFVTKLGAADRTDDGLRKRLAALNLTITKPQGETLLSAVVQEKETLFDAHLRDPINTVPQAVRDQLAAPSAQRAVLVDMFYQSAKFFGPSLLEALRADNDVAAALEIGFLSNKKPREDPGTDARNLARAEAFFGGALAPRSEAEAEALLRAIAARSDALAQALHNREGGDLSEPYRRRLQGLVDASVSGANIDTTLTLQADGSFQVGKEVPLDALARAFGLSPQALALANPDVFPMPPEGPAKFPAGKTLHLLARQAPPRRGHASLEIDDLAARLSPAALAALDADAWRIPPELELAAARYDVPELAALPAFDLGIDLPKLAAAYDFSATPGPDWLPSLLLPEPRHTESFAPDFPITPRHGVNQAVLARIAASFERCERAVEELDRQIDNWIERRNALRRRRGFD